MTDDRLHDDRFDGLSNASHRVIGGSTLNANDPMLRQARELLASASDRLPLDARMDDESRGVNSIAMALRVIAGVYERDCLSDKILGPDDVNKCLSVVLLGLVHGVSTTMASLIDKDSFEESVSIFAKQLYEALKLDYAAMQVLHTTTQ